MSRPTLLHRWRGRLAEDASPPLTSRAPGCDAIAYNERRAGQHHSRSRRRLRWPGAVEQLSLFRCGLRRALLSTDPCTPTAPAKPARRDRVRPRKTPGGVEVLAHLSPPGAASLRMLARGARHLRKKWNITLGPRRSHGAGRTAPTMCSRLPGARPLSERVDDEADEEHRRTRSGRRGHQCAALPRPDAEPVLRPASGAPSRVSEPRLSGLDARFVVADLECGSPKWILDDLCIRTSSAENLIRLRRTRADQIARPAVPLSPNQVRLVLRSPAPSG